MVIQKSRQVDHQNYHRCHGQILSTQGLCTWIWWGFTEDPGPSIRSGEEDAIWRQLCLGGHSHCCAHLCRSEEDLCGLVLSFYQADWTQVNQGLSLKMPWPLNYPADPCKSLACWFELFFILVLNICVCVCVDMGRWKPCSWMVLGSPGLEFQAMNGSVGAGLGSSARAASPLNYIVCLHFQDLSSYPSI